jgi:hypothetical protein
MALGREGLVVIAVALVCALTYWLLVVRRSLRRAAQ